MGSILSASVDKGLVKWFISNHLPNDSKICLLTTNTSFFELRKRFKIIRAYDDDEYRQIKKRKCSICQGDAKLCLNLLLFSILMLYENGKDIVPLAKNCLISEPIYNEIILLNKNYLECATSQYSPENEACYCMHPCDSGYNEYEKEMMEKFGYILQ